MTHATTLSRRIVQTAACTMALVATTGRVALAQGSGAGLTQAQRLADTVGAVIDGAVRDAVFPGAIAVVGTRDGVRLQRAAGHLDWSPSPVPDAETLWDLASLTKVVGLTTAMMQLVDAGAVDLDAPVVRYLPAFTGPDKDQVTVRQLLTHSSGLPAVRLLYREAPNRDSALALVFATPLDAAPGERMVYSDLGAILLGQIVERVSGEAFDGYLQRHVFGPLGMTETMFRPPAAWRDRIAPTEVDPWRGRHLRGEVHDENTFILGGVSSHAGLFSTARDLTLFARMMLSGGSLNGVTIVRPSTLAAFTKVQDPALSHRALGWETPNGTNSAGHGMSPRAYGHTGFTGTSLWIDPDRDVFVLLLTNRVNPTRERGGIGPVRVALADAVMAVLGSRSGSPRAP